jgi:hypothetical protein
MTNKINFLSASDRLNYGDLLFPLVFQYILSTHKPNTLSMQNFGLIESDLRYFGAIKTKSFRQLQKSLALPNQNLIIGGGEVFFPSWKTLFSYIHPLYAKTLKSYRMDKLEDRLQLSRRMLSGRNIPFPFSPNSNAFNNSETNIFYNSVGGTISPTITELEKSLIVDSLKSAKHISVRCERTLQGLKELGISSQLVPDSALIMSDIYSKSSLKERASIPESTLNEDYVFFQCAVDKTPSNLLVFANSLESILKKLKLKAIFCPIGLCSNHSDDVPLKKLVQQSPLFSYVNPKNIFDVMALIAYSKSYIGTSLHGMITAYSFGTPFVPINPSVKKLDQYCKTWTSDFCAGSIKYEEIENLGNILRKWDFIKASEALESQKSLIYSNINSMVSQFS